MAQVPDVVTKKLGPPKNSSLQRLLAMPGAPREKLLQYWVRQGYLHPKVTKREGRDHWEWSEEETRRAVEMNRLYEAGLRPAVAAKFLDKGTTSAYGTRTFFLGIGVVLELRPLQREPPSTEHPQGGTA